MSTCTGCGSNVPEGVSFCTSCGKTIAEPSVSMSAQSAPQPVYARQPSAGGLSAPSDGQYAVVSTAGWVGTLILLGIPIIGLIACFVWAFGSGNHNRRNLARACLILTVVCAVFAVVLSVAMAAMFQGLIGPYIEQINAVRGGMLG